MKNFLNDCLKHYALMIVFTFWLPLMVITMPIAFVAVCVKIAYEFMYDMFEVGDE